MKLNCFNSAQLKRILVSATERERKAGPSGFPRVEVRGTSIFIIYGEGDEVLWGSEGSQVEAVATAKQIEREFGALSHVARRIANLMNDLMDELVELGVPVEHAAYILYEGYAGFLTDKRRELGRRPR